MNKGASLDKTS